MKTFPLLLHIVLSTALFNHHTDEPKSIIGRWGICQTTFFDSIGVHKSKTSTMNFNVCPVITFTKDSTGFTGASSSELQYFNWSIKNKKLHIKNKSQKNSVVADGFYTLNYEDGVLQLIDSISLTKTFKYILGSGHNE